MLGIIVKIPNDKKKEGMIISYDDKRYYFTVEDYDPRLKLSVSDDVDFTPCDDDTNSERGLFKKYAHVDSIVRNQIPTERNGFYLSKSSDIQKLKITELSKSYVLVGESTNKEHALDMMIDTAVKAGCTALTDIRVSTHIPKFNNSIIFIIRGIPAIGTKVDLNKYIEQENQARSTRNPKTVSAGIKAEMPKTPDASHPEKTKIVEKERICIPKEKIRKFSPNIARRILQRTIFSVVMLLLLPVLASIAFEFDDIYESYLTLIFIMLVEMGLVVFYYNVNPNKSCCYFRIKHN